MECLLEKMEQDGLEGMFVSRPVNVKYVSHYTGEDSYLLLTRRAKYFITDPRYTEQVSYECPDYTIVEWRDTYGSVAAALGALARDNQLKTIGYEASHLTVAQYQAFQKELTAELVVPPGIETSVLGS